MRKRLQKRVQKTYNPWKCSKKSEISTGYTPKMPYNPWKSQKKYAISTGYKFFLVYLQRKINLF